MATLELDKLCQTVQRNCDISDSQYAQRYGLCTYLLKMRELYRWEKKLPLTARLSNGDIGDWLTEREALWESLENQDYTCIPLFEHCCEPFESEQINQQLVPQGMVYSGGYGRFCKPQFFVAELLEQRQLGDIQIYITNQEFARDIAASPAMIVGKTIFIRRESVRRALWERLEEWQWQKTTSYFARLSDTYAIEADMETALNHMADDEIDTMLHHEFGEIQAGELLGTVWDAMLVDFADHKIELMLRAFRDHLADCLVTLPQLLEQQHEARLLFYFANLKGMRKALFPKLTDAYQTWLNQPANLTILQTVVQQGEQHWRTVTQNVLLRYQQDKQHCMDYLNSDLAQFAL